MNTITESNKPVVYYSGIANFWMWNEKNEVASLELVYNHPVLGVCCDVRTSTVLRKEADGSFETHNTLYKPVTKEITNVYEYAKAKTH